MIRALRDQTILAYLAENPEAPTRAIVAHVPARRAAVLESLNRLASSTLAATKGPRGARTWSIRPEVAARLSEFFGNQSRPRESS
jgi:hypothetical protein